MENKTSNVERVTINWFWGELSESELISELIIKTNIIDNDFVEIELIDDAYLNEDVLFVRAERNAPPNLIPAGKAAYDRAVECYLEGNHLHESIRLNSATRSAAEQGRLFRDWVCFDQFDCTKEANKADRPGKSVHNYGLAIDVIFGPEKALISNCLERAGWIHDRSGEWHFEFRKTPRFAEIGVVQKELERTMYDYAETVVLWFREEKEARAVKQLIDAEKAKLEPERRELAENRRILNIENERLQNERKSLDIEKGEIARLTRENSELLERIEQMTESNYRSCPNGQSWSECDHDDLKEEYLERRRALQRLYDSQRQRISERSVRWRSSTNRFSEDLTAYRRQVSAYNQRKRQYDLDARRLNELVREFRSRQAEMRRLKNIEDGLLSQIQARLDAFFDQT